MSSKKISISRKWLEPVPVSNGQKLPASLWPEHRRHCWIVRWYSTKGNRHGKLFDKKREAERFAFELQEQVNDGKQDKPEEITLKRFISEHKNLMVKQISAKSVRCHLRSLKVLADFLGDSKYLAKITPRDAEAFIAYRLSQNLSLATINHDIRNLKRIFNIAIEPRGYLKEGTNPFRKIKQRKISPKTIRYLTVNEYRALINASRTLWWKAFISVAYCCGLRRGEIVNLTWADIDFINQMIHVRAKDANDMILKWESKTHENRSVPMPDETSRHLANLQAEADDGYPYVFIPPERLQLIRRREQQHQWSDAHDARNNFIRDFGVIRKRSGVAKCTIHDMRRSAITNWAQVLPIQVVQQFSGHSTITTTRKYYLAVRPEDVKKAGDFLNNLLAPEKVNL